MRMAKVEVREADVTKLEVDAIANAANTRLAHGGGVAGAIARAGGPSIQEESNRLAPIGLGEAVATPAGDLPSRWVIHAATMELGGPTSRGHHPPRDRQPRWRRPTSSARVRLLWSRSGPGWAASRSRRRRGSRSRRCGATSRRAAGWRRIVFAVFGGTRGRRSRRRCASSEP